MKRSMKTGAEERQERDAALLKMRFEATIHPGRQAKTKDWADDLEVDRVPDARGQVRALLTVEDLARLLDRGLEVRLHRAHPYEPLDPDLILPEDAFKSWLDERVSALKAKPGPEPFTKP
jgi:hypothetical protein